MARFRSPFNCFYRNLWTQSEIRQIVEEWVQFLKEEMLWGNDDPLFPATRVTVGPSRQFEVEGLERKQWNTAGPIRTIFRQAFEGAGLPYSHPHSFRKTLVHLGEQICKTPEQFKAWSQNFGHEMVLTTFTSYGTVRTDRQGEIIRKLSASQQSGQSEADTLLEKLRAAGVRLSVEP
jgi:integrase